MSTAASLLHTPRVGLVIKYEDILGTNNQTDGWGKAELKENQKSDSKPLVFPLLFFNWKPSG